MKKRKPPVVLASMLVVLAGLAVLFIPKVQDPTKMPPPQPEASQKDPTPTGEKRATPSKEQIRAKVNKPNQIDQDDGTMAIGETGANPTVSTIFLPKARPVKQTPNDASVQGQWYRDNARANRKEGFN
jgi:hypothetical protein